MKRCTELYVEQRTRWPISGRHILAQFDAESIVVYQAYRPGIGHFAAENGYFGGDFSLGRMSWIKPNFLWMMYRSGWATKSGQEVVLAVRLKRVAFDAILAQAVHSSFTANIYASQEDWKEQVKKSDVRLQWDPDHAPCGAQETRRAVQLGLRGDVLRKYARDWVLDIEDISEFVAEQRQNVATLGKLLVPREDVYPVADASVAARFGI